MNSNFTVQGTTTEGEVITFSGGGVAFPFNGSTQSVTMPGATITFTSQVSSPTTVYNSATGTWNTEVPVGYSGNVFLTGVGWQVPSPGITSNISGNQVAMNGTFSSTSPNTTVQWQWQAAAYSNTGTNVSDFTTNMNNLGRVQAADGSGLLAGTPDNNISGGAISGGSGGGSSNYTGGHSGTAHIQF